MAADRHHIDDRQMALRHHFQELSRRFLLIVVILLTASILVYVYRSTVVPIILQPLAASFGDQKLMFLNPAGGFNFIFFISLYVGIAAAAPFIVQQLYSFIRPVLPKSAQRLSLKIIISSSLLLIAGVLFGYYVAVPGALKFLVEFAGEYVSAALTADSYLHFLVAYTLGLGLLFQIPFILIIGNYIKPFTPSSLLKTERWAILLIVTAAAIITPTPDPINLLIVAVPILLVYQIGVVAVLVTIFKTKRKMSKMTAQKKRHNVSPVETIVKLNPQSRVALNGVRLVPPVSVAHMPAASYSVDGFKRSTRSSTGVIVPPRTVPAPLSQPDALVRRMGTSPAPVALRRYVDGVSVMLPQ